jgi:16S rRNA (adenine1518-N6/adenine1519-N6)-dimethyltransferase
MAHPKEILLKLQANARKTFSQNFLTSPHWADLLTRRATEMPEAEEIWEIGPGLGALTAQLLEMSTRPVRAFEIDRKLAAYLRETYPRLDLIEGDFLEANIRDIAPEKQSIVVISNLPYGLSSPILFKLLEEKHRIRRLVLTFQKEYAERASPGSFLPRAGRCVRSPHARAQARSRGRSGSPERARQSGVPPAP